MALNLAAILSNGGRMPATPGAMEAAGLDFAVKHNSVASADPALPWLVDRFAAPDWVPLTNVFSAGDLVIALGSVVLVFAATGAIVGTGTGAGLPPPLAASTLEKLKERLLEEREEEWERAVARLQDEELDRLGAFFSSRIEEEEERVRRRTGNGEESEIEEGDATTLKLEWERRAAEVLVTTALNTAYQNLAAAHIEATTLKTQVLPGAQSAFEAVSRGYRLGKFGFLDVLDAQRTLFGAKAQYLHYPLGYADLQKTVTEKLEQDPCRNGARCDQPKANREKEHGPALVSPPSLAAEPDDHGT